MRRQRLRGVGGVGPAPEHLPELGAHTRQRGRRRLPPLGDFWEVWYNRGGDTPSAVNVEFNYKGIDDRWKTAVQQIVVGRTHFRVRRNILEHRHIFFRITESKQSPISEYRTT